MTKVEGVEKANLDIAKGVLTIVHEKTVSQKLIVEAIQKSPFKLKELSGPVPIAKP